MTVLLLTEGYLQLHSSEPYQNQFRCAQYRVEISNQCQKFKENSILKIYFILRFRYKSMPLPWLVPFFLLCYFQVKVLQRNATLLDQDPKSPSAHLSSLVHEVEVAEPEPEPEPESEQELELELEPMVEVELAALLVHSSHLLPTQPLPTGSTTINQMQ